MYNVQQRDLDILRQSENSLYSRIQVLNTSGVIVDEIQGELIGGSFGIDANSDIRRTCDLSLYVSSQKYLAREDAVVWLNKFIRVSVGVVYNRTREIVWYNCGTYLFTKSSYTYDAETNSLTLSCSDLMSYLTGLRNGQISGLSTFVGAGEYIRNVLVATITQLTPFRTYYIEDIKKEIPYDLKFETGSTVYSLISKIRDLYPAWETYFDINEMFVCKQIPTLESDPIFLDETILDPLIISENYNIDYAGVKNVTEVWGKCLSSDWFAASSTYSSNIYNLNITSFVLTSTTTVGFTATSNNDAGAQVRFNGAGNTYPIVDENLRPIPQNTILAGKSYVLKLKNEVLIYLGEYQIRAEYKDINPDSPFYVHKNDGVGEIRQVLSGGDYEKIYSEDLAMQRAKYENWKSTRLNDSVTLTIIPIFWLDVNIKIRYTSPITKELNTCIIKNIKYSAGNETMTIDAIKFYPLYPDIV